MTLLRIAAPLLLSLRLGQLIIDRIFRKSPGPRPLIHFFLSFGLGLGISSQITFLSFPIFQKYHRPFVILFHLVLVTGLSWLNHKRNRPPASAFPRRPIKKTAITFFLLLVLPFLPLTIQAWYFPQGGWDAWSVWNFKAKFLFLANGAKPWQNLFDPLLWRSSPHYQLLLPLLNVWGWAFLPQPLAAVPMTVALLFTFLVGGLTYAILIQKLKRPQAILAPLLFLTLPFYGVLATSQYAEIIMSFYILAAIYCAMETFNHNNPGYALLSGLFLGLLAFLKPDGMMAAAIIFALSLAFFLWPWILRRAPLPKAITGCFLLGIILTSLATLYFQTQLSPGNITFINGWTSSLKPASLSRLKITLAFLLMELKSGKWHGIWLLSLFGIFLVNRAGFRKSTALLPLFLFSYLAVVLLYYLTNTYFEIYWWVTVTLNRILFSVLPVFILWIFLSCGKNHNNTSNET